MRDRLYRSRQDRVIGGVAGGVAEALGIDPSIVRVVWVVLAFLTGGIAAFVYLVMLIVVPEDPSAGYDWSAAAPATTADEAAASAASDETVVRPVAAPPAWTSRPPARASTTGPGGGALVFGVILILIGGYFLLREFVPQLDTDVLWPVVVIGLGVVLLAGALRPGAGTRT